MKNSWKKFATPNHAQILATTCKKCFKRVICVQHKFVDHNMIFRKSQKKKISKKSKNSHRPGVEPMEDPKKNLPGAKKSKGEDFFRKVNGNAMQSGLQC